MSKLSPAEPVSVLRRIKIADNGEPLVDFLAACPKITQDRPRFHYRRETLVRQSVAERLNLAAETLSGAYRIAIVEGWRPPHIQKRMYLASWRRFQERHPDWSDHQLRRVVNRFTAPIDRRVPPPHTTGGAVDVFLTDLDGNPMDLMSPYEMRDPHAFPLNAPGLSEAARANRQILSSALIGAGITNYPSEYWHYSYGDQGWAYRGGHPSAIYGAVVPPDWAPHAADVSEEPLVFIGI
jgi:D-alanyl-D-alanine dipeptidase